MGLIEGYCNANQLPLEILSKDNALHSSSIINQSGLIIIDACHPDSSLSKSKYMAIAKISSNHHIPVCTLVDQKNSLLRKTEANSWVDHSFEAPILEQLDSYIRIHFHYKPHPFPERRHQERRTPMNRRYSGDSQLLTTANLFHHNSIESEKTKNNNRLGPFVIDNSCQSVSFEGVDLELTCKEFKLFSLLACY